MYNIMFRQLYTLQNAHHDKCNYHLLPDKTITLLLTMCYIFHPPDLFVL